jgi:putative signal transducing protein
MSSKSDELVSVHTFSSSAEADLAKSALEAAGIEAIVHADSVGAMYPTDGGIGYDVVVRAEDAAAARDILEIPAVPEDPAGP